MNTKHYVSLEVAKILKEKGYNEETQYLQVDSALHKGLCINYLKPELCGGMKVDDTTAFPAPSLLEAMDWLEERGIFISVEYFGGNEWRYFIYSSKYLEDNYETDDVFYTDRYECMNAAVKKGGELL